MTNIRSAIANRISGFQVFMLSFSDSNAGKQTNTLIINDNKRLNLETIPWLLVRSA
jgi:hypothetical protein